jgi:hypothetical protein
MNSIQVNSNINITVTDILKGVSQLETTDLEYFLAEISQMLAQRKIGSLTISANRKFVNTETSSAQAL